MFRSGLLYALLLVLPIAVAAPAMLRGDLPLDLRLPLTQPPWQDARPAAMDMELSEAAHRHATQTYPWYRFLRSAGEERFLPLWYPLEGLGYPFLAAWRTRALSPFSLPVYFFPLEYSLWCAALLKLVVAGWSMQWLARGLGLDRLIAFSAAIAYQWSAGIYRSFEAPLSDTVAWLPLLLLALDGVARGRPRAWALAAFVWGLMLLGGEATLLATVPLLGLVYLVLRGMPSAVKGTRLPLLRAATLWLALGLGVAAVQLLPYAEFLGQGTLGDTSAGSLRFASLLALFSPALLPPAEPVFLSEARLLYAGAPQWLLLALWFAVRGFANPERRRSVDALLTASAALVGLSLLLHALPGARDALGAFAPSYLALGIAPALALAAAAALPAWLGLDPEQVKEALSRLALWMLPLWGAALAAAGFGFYADVLTDRDLAVLLGSMVVLFGLLSITLVRPRRRLMVSGLALLTFASLLHANRPDFQFTPATLAFPETEMTRSLRAMGGRVGGSDTLRAWPLAGSGIAQAFSTSGIRLRRYEDFMARAKKEPRLFRRSATSTLLFSRHDIQGEFAELRPHLRIEEIYPSGAVLFRDLDARSEARIAPRVRTVAEYDPALLDAEQPPIFEGTAPPNAESSETVSASALRSGNPNEVVVSLPAEAPGVLVLADAHYPGWHAESKGKTLPVAAVDGLFRGVRMGAGAEELRFSFRPASLRLGALLSLASLALLVVVALWPRPKPVSDWAR